MLTKMRNILRTTWRQAQPSTVDEFPRLSGAELARSSWAKLIESYADVPIVYQDFFCPFFVDGLEFPYTVLTPSRERFIHRTSEKLICDIDREIYVVERIGNSLNTQCYPYDGISYVEYKTALLASSLKICGVTNGGFQAASTLSFNSVTDYLFAPILKRVRGIKTDSTQAVEDSKPEQFDHLAKVNYKFMNYARHSLLGEERVVLSVLQPEIRESLLAFLGKSYYRTISPTHMLILTDRELIVIREEAVRRKEDRYGGIWDYIPLRKINSLSLSERGNNLIDLSIQLPGNTRLEFLFQVFTREDLNQLIDRFREMSLDVPF